MSRLAHVDFRDSVAYPGRTVVEVVDLTGEVLCSFNTFYNDAHTARRDVIRAWRALGDWLVDTPEVVSINQDNPQEVAS